MKSPYCLNWIILLVANTFNSQMFTRAFFPPTFIVQPQKGEYLYRMDSTVILPCSSRALPPANYEWLKNGRPIENLVVNQSDGSLKIERAMKENEGGYQCVAYNNLGRAISHISELKMAYISSYSTMGERTIEVYLGGSAILECDRPSCYPPPSIQWVNVKEGVKIISFEEDYRRILDDKGNLHITKIMKEDDGEVYLCISTNTFLRTMKRGADTKIKLKTQTIPMQPSKSIITLYHSKTEIVTLFNSTITLSCIFSRGAVKWYRNNPRKVALKVNQRIKMIRQGTTLKLTNVTYSDSGKYSCNPYTPRSRLSVKFSIQVVEKPNFITYPVDTTVAINESHVFECSASGTPAAEIAWTSNGQDIRQYLDGDRIQLIGNKLILKQLTPKDIGTLQCNASNLYGYVYTNAFINVWNKPPLLIQAPQKYLKGVLQKQILIECHTFSVPPPRLDWKKDSYKLNFDVADKYKVDSNGNLLIKNLNSNDAGVYDCTASNIFGRIKGESTVVIREATKIISFSDNKILLINTDTILECSAKTDRLEGHNLVIEWWKNSERLKRSKSQSSSQLISSLKLDTLSPRDSGSYYCNASNGLDWDIRKIDMIVEGKPEPAHDVLVNCSKYLSKRLALLSWIDGFNNNADITSHILEFKTQFDSESWFEISPTNGTAYVSPDNYRNQDRNFVLLSLQPYLDYNFRIRSVNRLGISEPSEITVTKCQLERQRPNINPEKVFIYGSKPNMLKIIWKPVPYLYHNGPNMTYVIIVRCTNCDHIAQDSAYQFTVPTWSINQLTVTNLSTETSFSKIEIYKRYGVKIQSRNIVGLSSSLPKEYFGYSGESYPVIVPNKAIILEVTDHSVRLQWTVIHSSQISDVNGFFRGYRIEWCLNETSEELCIKKKKYQDEILFKHTDTDLQFRFEAPNYGISDRKKRDTSIKYGQLYTTTLSGLPGMTSIQIWTRIINIQYAGPKSPEIRVRTKEGTPSPVAEFNIETVEINYIEIAWAKPLIINGILIGYEVSVKEIFPGGKGGNIVRTLKIKDPDQLRERISNLKSETMYHVYIWPMTRQGKGKEKYLVAQTRAESKESNLIQLKIKKMEKNHFNMSIMFTESIQKQLDLPAAEWKFYLQFRLMKKIMWEETEKQYIYWWKIIGNLLSDETYLIRAVVNTKTGSIVSQSRLVRTGINEIDGNPVLRSSWTTWFIILLILIFGLLCGVIGLFLWRRKKVLYLRGKPTIMISDAQQQQLHHHLLIPNQDQYASFVTYSTQESKKPGEQLVSKDCYSDKVPYLLQNCGTSIGNKTPDYYRDPPNRTSVVHYTMNNPHCALPPSHFSSPINRTSQENNHIPSSWSSPKTNAHTLDLTFNTMDQFEENEKLFYEQYDYSPIRNPVSTSFV